MSAHGTGDGLVSAGPVTGRGDGLILHVVIAGDVGGAERVVLDLVELSRAAPGARPHAIALCTRNAALREFFARPGIRVLEGPSSSGGPLGYLWASWGTRLTRWLVEVVQQTRAAALHLHTFAGHVVGARAAHAADLPFVRTEHSRRVYDDLSCWPFSRWSLARASAVVAVSEHVAGAVLARAPWSASRLVVVPNGVTLPDAATALVPTAVRGRFVIVARLEPRKGVDLALRALPAVPGAFIDIVGDGPARRGLEALARQMGVFDRVAFHGWKRDPAPFFATADAALMPSRTEGMPIVALEAMAHARAVVARPVGGLPEVVQDGVTGWLAADESVASLAEAMRGAVAAGPETAARGRAGRARAEALFSRTTMAAGYERVYQHIVS